MKDASLGFLGKSLMAAALAYLGLNTMFFMYFYGNTLSPYEIPYHENFEDLSRIDYRRFGGNWKLAENKLFQHDASDTDLLAVIPVELDPQQSYQFSTRMNFRSRNVGGGLVFNMQSKDSRAESHLVRFGATGEGEKYLVWGYFNADFEWQSQGGMGAPDSVNEGGFSELTVQVDGDVYHVLVDGVEMARDIPLQYKGGTVALTTWFSIVAFDTVSIEPYEAVPVQVPAPTEQPAPVEPAPTTPAPVVVAETTDYTYVTDFATGNADGRWRMLSGDWRFENGSLIQALPDGFDFTAVYLEPVVQPTIEVRFRHDSGLGAGIVFNLPSADSLRGGHLVRYYPESQLIWGYFNAEREFQGQGAREVTPPADGWHTLRITSTDATFSIALDGETLASNIPLNSTSGYAGLTSSQSVVTFDSFAIATAGSELPQPDAVVINNGEWVRDGDLLTQTIIERGFYFDRSGFYGNVYDLHLNVQLPAEDGVVGGIIFHSTNGQSPSEGHFVRFRSDGLMGWGRVNTFGDYQVYGTHQLETTSTPIDLQLAVRDTIFSIVVNGTTIVGDVPLATEEGWIYLTATGGPITFAEFTVELVGVGS